MLLLLLLLESVNCVMVDVNEVPGENPIAKAIAKCWSTKFKLVQSNSEIVHLFAGSETERQGWRSLQIRELGSCRDATTHNSPH